MPLNIRNPLTDALAAQLAKLTEETKTEAVTQALKERLERIRRTRGKRRLADDLDDIALHCAALPILDARSDEQILGYASTDFRADGHRYIGGARHPAERIGASIVQRGH